jgi:probable phosphoglycerate mutase
LTRIYLIRHAEAEGNLYRRAHGHYDGRLTKNGLAQTERLSDWFSHRPVDAVYASDLRRAVRTAEAVASVCHKPVQTDPALREVNLGEWEDKPWGEIKRMRSDYMLFFSGSAPWSVKGAETAGEVCERVSKALRRIAEAHEGQDVAVVSHGCAIRFALQSFSGGEIPHLDNASVSCLEFTGGAFTVLSFGENRHLGELSTFAKQSWWRNDPKKIPDAELWFSPVLLPEDISEAMYYCREAWYAIYGSMDGFRDDTGEKALYESADTHPRFLQFVMDRDRRIGLVHLRDAGRLSAFDGHISLLFLDPDKRGLGLGSQLLGESVSIARACGKTGLSLRVFNQNTQAISFYHKMGFAVIGSERGFFGTLLHMRMGI